MLRHLLHFILYSNIWIALAAVAMCGKTVMLLGQEVWTGRPLYGFIFCATLFIYAGHRVVGLYKAKPFVGTGRYQVISQFKWHIWTYATLGGVGALYFFYLLSVTSQWLLLVPGLLSLAYIFPIPFIKEKKRLRDFDGIKIFLVALVWTVVAVVLPYVELAVFDYKKMIINSLEVFTFIFAITIPFDIRDLEVDAYNHVKTLATDWGIKRAKKTALLLLLLSFIFFLLGHPLSIQTLLALGLGYGITAYLIYAAHPHRSDYYYTGLLDGTMILVPLLYVVL